MAPFNFLASDNVAGQTLLRLVSRGNAIIAEIFRLAEFVPEEFRLATKEHQRNYGEILLDFTYFKMSELANQRIENNADLLDRDDAFQESHIGIITRFYLLFESIFKYVKDLVRYLQDLDEGVFIQQSLEIVIAAPEGKQLLAEALFLYGTMLLTLDRKIEGVIRERMLVAYHRYKADAPSSSNLDDVCKLCRATGFSVNAPKKPANYPEDFFKRYPLPRSYIQMIIGRLRTDDIYGQIAEYPNPEHRSTALGTQATMLYVMLFFAPEILQNDQAKMREIVDKHFPDNWVIAYYLGIVVDLSEVWEDYKAAKHATISLLVTAALGSGAGNDLVLQLALNNTLDLANVRMVQQRYVQNVARLNKDLEYFLNEGVLTESFVLDNVTKLLSCLRDCNVTIRWLMLHTNTRNKRLRDLLVAGFQETPLVILLLNTSQLEYKLRNMFNLLLKQKRASWDNYKKEASERMEELSDYFSGTKALTRVTKNEQLQAWFKDISGQIQSLDYVDATVAGRKIVQLIQALEEVQEFHQLESNLQVRAFLADTRGFLTQMIRTVNVKEEVLVSMQLVGDLSYAWEIIARYVHIFQALIKRDPGTVIKLRAVFMKLASILDLPLVRISQANSKDIVSVAQYYSGELVEFIRRVLQVIPASMFDILNAIISLQTNKLQEVPTRLEKDRLKDFAQLDERFDLARRTHSISVFTEGMLAMETTLVGVIQVNPKQLLEDGIRRELVVQIARAMDDVLVFSKGKPGELEQRLAVLAQRLDGFRRSFEYIQDYVNIYALKIWQEELTRIILFNVERECNSFLKTRIFEWDSAYQSTAIPIPVFPPRDDKSVDCVGRLAREILALSDPKLTVYVHPMSAWYDAKTTREHGAIKAVRSIRLHVEAFDFSEIVGLKTFTNLFQAVGTVGLTGLDRLYSFMNVRLLQRFADMYRRVMKAEKGLHQFLTAFAAELEPVTALPPNGGRVYANAVSKASKLFSVYLDHITTLGHVQLVRRMIGNELTFRCKLDSTTLSNTVGVLNDSLLNDIKNHYRDQARFAYPSENNPLLFESSTIVEACGMNDAFKKIYITTKPLEDFSAVTFLYVIAQLPKFAYDSQTGTYLCKNKADGLDGTPFVVGIISVLKQFHVGHTESFLAYMGQYVRSTINASVLKAAVASVGWERGGIGGYIRAEQRISALPPDATNALIFLEEFCKYSEMPRTAVEAYVPAFLFSQFKH